MQFGIEVQDGFGSLYCTNEVNDIYIMILYEDDSDFLPIANVFIFLFYSTHTLYYTNTPPDKNSLSTHPCEGAHTHAHRQTQPHFCDSSTQYIIVL